jgi:hypothetical protein
MKEQHHNRIQRKENLTLWILLNYLRVFVLVRFYAGSPESLNSVTEELLL